MNNFKVFPISMNSKINNCPVCGLEQAEPPWGVNGVTPSYQICSCCGIHYGVEDDTYEQVVAYRQKWLANGAVWFDSKVKPDDWELNEQLKGIPEEYL